MESIHIPCENHSAIQVEKTDTCSVVICGKGSRVRNSGHEDLLITPDPLITQVCSNQNGQWPPCSRATNSAMRGILKRCVPPKVATPNERRKCLLSFFLCGIQTLTWWGSMKLWTTHFVRNRKTQEYGNRWIKHFVYRKEIAGSPWRQRDWMASAGVQGGMDSAVGRRKCPGQNRLAVLVTSRKATHFSVKSSLDSDPLTHISQPLNCMMKVPPSYF